MQSDAKTGTELTVAIMNSYTFNLLSKTDAVKNRYLTTNGMSLGYLTENEVKAVVESTSGLRIAIYDKQYRDESKVAHAFVPNGYVCLIPDGTLGGTWYGTTPEEADLRGASQCRGFHCKYRSCHYPRSAGAPRKHQYLCIRNCPAFL